MKFTGRQLLSKFLFINQSRKTQRNLLKKKNKVCEAKTLRKNITCLEELFRIIL